MGKVLDYCCIGISALATSIQANEVFKWIQLVLTIISLLIVIIRNLVSWYKKANEDKKITIDEVDEALKIVDEGIKEIKEKIPNEDSRNK